MDKELKSYRVLVHLASMFAAMIIMLLLVGAARLIWLIIQSF